MRPRLEWLEPVKELVEGGRQLERELGLITLSVILLVPTVVAGCVGIIVYGLR